MRLEQVFASAKARDHHLVMFRSKFHVRNGWIYCAEGSFEVGQVSAIGIVTKGNRVIGAAGNEKA
jgi:hypothetical protein